MPKYLMANYYAGSVIHEVEADNEDQAIEKARDMNDDINTSDLNYDETVCLEVRE